MKDPVRADIEAFDRHATPTLKASAAPEIERRLAQAQTPQEVVAILDEWRGKLDTAVAVIDSYHAKTPEFGKILKDMRDNLALASEGAGEMRAAVLSGHRMKLSDATIKIARSNSGLVAGMNAFRRLAEEKGYEIKE